MALCVRPTWNMVFMEQLIRLSKRRRCLKIQTAALIAVDTRVVCFGYNGTFAKHTECNDYWRQYYTDYIVGVASFDEWTRTTMFKDMHREWSKNNEVHAEANALSMISKLDIRDQHVMYTMYSPCDACAKAILSYGLKHIYYKIEYSRGDNALIRLRDAGVTCKKIS